MTAVLAISVIRIDASAEDLELKELAVQFAAIRDWDNAACEGSAGVADEKAVSALKKAIGSRSSDPQFLETLERAMRDLDDDDAAAVCTELLRTNSALFTPLP
jgi:hypothetical protein